MLVWSSAYMHRYVCDICVIHSYDARGDGRAGAARIHIDMYMIYVQPICMIHAALAGLEQRLGLYQASHEKLGGITAELVAEPSEMSVGVAQVDMLSEPCDRKS